MSGAPLSSSWAPGSSVIDASPRRSWMSGPELLGLGADAPSGAGLFGVVERGEEVVQTAQNLVVVRAQGKPPGRLINTVRTKSHAGDI